MKFQKLTTMALATAIVLSMVSSLIAQSIAVLPFEFTTNEAGMNVDMLQRSTQSDCIKSFKKEVAMLKVQDQMTTNAILNKNGLDVSATRMTLPADLCSMLGVDYVVYGSVMVHNEGTRTTGSDYTSVKTKEDKSKEQDKGKASVTTTTSSTTTQTYDAVVEMNVYDSGGENVYSNTHEPFSVDPQDFSSTTDWLVKRSPWGSKRK